jgi:hypothetical protein
MSTQRPLLFDRSVTALAARKPRNGMERRSPMPLSIQLTPEPDPIAHTLELRQDQTTGPLPLGFEFELFGVRYTWFELSSDGFMTFGPDPSPSRPGCLRPNRFIPVDADQNNFIALGVPESRPAGPRVVAYEVRGAPGRRRLVLSLGEVRLLLHERTGMIDVRLTPAA